MLGQLKMFNLSQTIGIFLCANDTFVLLHRFCILTEKLVQTLSLKARGVRPEISIAFWVNNLIYAFMDLSNQTLIH